MQLEAHTGEGLLRTSRRPNVQTSFLSKSWVSEPPSGRRRGAFPCHVNPRPDLPARSFFDRITDHGSRHGHLPGGNGARVLLERRAAALCAAPEVLGGRSARVGVITSAAIADHAERASQKQKWDLFAEPTLGDIRRGTRFSALLSEGRI
jgi:hypothetical protein